MRPLPAACLALAVALAAAGCTGQSERGARPSPAPAVASPPAPAAGGCGDPTRTLIPMPPPAPGAMPAGTFLRTIQDRGRLVAGVSGDRPQLGVLNPLDNQLEGFEVDLLREVARAIFGTVDGHLELRAVTEAEAGPLLARGAIDVAARQLAITCASRGRLDFSAPYLSAAQRVLVARDAPARGVEDLRGKHVCAAAGSPALAALATVASRPVPVGAPDWNECMVLFQQGEVDAVSAPDVTLLGFVTQDPYARIVSGVIAEELYGIAAAPGQSDLVRFLNAVLARMAADGRWTALHDEWLGQFGQAPPAAEYAG